MRCGAMPCCFSAKNSEKLTSLLSEPQKRFRSYNCSIEFFTFLFQASRNKIYQKFSEFSKNPQNSKLYIFGSYVFRKLLKNSTPYSSIVPFGATRWIHSLFYSKPNPYYSDTIIIHHNNPAFCATKWRLALLKKVIFYGRLGENKRSQCVHPFEHRIRKNKTALSTPRLLFQSCSCDLSPLHDPFPLQCDSLG